MAKELERPIIGHYVKPSYCNPYGFPRRAGFSCYDVPAPPAYPPGSNPGQPPVTLDLIGSGNNTGYCSGDGCLEPTRVETRYDIKYSIPPYGVPVFDWSVSSNAEIVAGGGPTDKYVVVRTESTHDELFSIVLVVKDKNGEHSFQKNAIHYVKEKTSSLFVSNIEETLQGNCFYGQGMECTAVSEYGITIQSERMYTIQWYVDGASIVGDSNKNSVRVSSTGSEDTTINLRVLVSDGVTTVTKTGTFFHRRSESFSPVSIAGIEETSAGSCSHEPGMVCMTSSTYRVDASGGCGGNTYGWSVSSQSGNVHISGPSNEQAVTVSSTSMDAERFTLSVTVSDACGSSDTMSRQFSHGREETTLVPISITDIYMVSGDDSCEYNPGQTCVASATYAASLAGNTGSVAYKWTVSDGSIVGADDLSRVTVSTDSDSDTQFNLILDVSDVNSSDRMVKSLTHHHSEKVHVRIDNVTESQHGSCGYYAGSECAARSTHIVSYSQEVGPVNIQWSVVSGNASVVSGGDTDTVIVESDSDTTENFTLSVAVTDDVGNDYAEASFTHDRTEVGQGLVKVATCSSDPFGDGSLMKKWLFDGNYDDMLGNGSFSVSIGGGSPIVEFEDGKLNQALRLECGSGDSVAVSSSENVPFDPNKGVTISMFIKIPDISKAGTFFYAHTGGYAENLSFFLRDGGKIFFETHGSESNDLSSDVIDENEWIHVVGISPYNENDMQRLYINGVLVAEGDIGESIGDSSFDTFDFYTDETVPPITIDTVEVYDRCLTSDEVASLYGQSYWHTADDIDPLGDGSEVAFYKFENDAVDEHGNYDGTVNAGISFSEGKFGQAYVGNGDDDSDIFIPDGLFARHVYTISGWIYYDGTNNSSFRLGSSQSVWSDCQRRINVYFTDSYIMFTLGQGQMDDDYHEYNGVVRADVPPEEGWHHFAMSIDLDNGYFIAYVDGALLGESEHNTSKMRYTGSMTAFQSLYSSYDGYEIPGTIDHIRVFDRMITEDEARCLYYEERNT